MQHTQLLHLSLVALALASLLLGGLAKLHRLLDRREPAITLGIAGGLECVIVAVELERDLVSGRPLKVSRLVKSQHALRRLVRGVSLLVEEEQTLASLAGVGDNGVGHLGLLTAHERVHVLRRDGVIAEPEFLLRRDEGPGR